MVGNWNRRCYICMYVKFHKKRRNQHKIILIKIKGKRPNKNRQKRTQENKDKKSTLSNKNTKYICFSQRKNKKKKNTNNEIQILSRFWCSKLEYKTFILNICLYFKIFLNMYRVLVEHIFLWLPDYTRQQLSRVLCFFYLTLIDNLNLNLF